MKHSVCFYWTEERSDAVTEICVVMCLQASRGQKSDPQENIELDSYNLGVSRAAGEPAEEEGVQGAE